MSGTKNVLKLMMHLSLLASMGFAVLLSLAQTDAALAAATAPPLGAAATFSVLGGSTVTNTGNSVITGDLGVSPGTSVTGFPPGVVSGVTHAGDADAALAQSDLVIAYNDLTGQTCDTDLTGQDLGGMTLTPGVYCFSALAQLTGTLTLDALGDANAVWVFKIGTTLTTASNASVLVINGGQDCNVFWQVGTSATLGISSTFAGNILAFTSITLNTGANVSGRALARDGAVTLDDNNVAVAVCATADIEVSKTGETLVPGTTGQLVYTILVMNNGPNTASSVSLDDVIPAGVGGNLSNVNYILDSGSLTPWSSPLALGDMNAGSSHTVLIYADVPSGMTSIGANTTTVSSATADLYPVNNSDTCTNLVSGGGDTDLSVTMVCQPLTIFQVACYDDPPTQLAYTITVSNNGPNMAPTVSLVDALPDGLTGVYYRIDGTAFGPWMIPCALGSLNSGESLEIQIYVQMDPGITTIDSNTASVTDASISDIIPVNNSITCVNPILFAPVVSKQALEFTSGSDTYVTVSQHSTLDLSTTGTLEAWIYPTSFTADAGIVFKGTSAACYGFGLGGGSLFSDGSANNIGFVLYDTTGTKHLLTDTVDTLQPAQWYHIACVWNLSASPTMSIYVNGILGASSAGAIPDLRANNEDLMIGTQNIAAAAFSGLIDEVRVWNAARNETNIQSFMCKKVVPFPTPDPNLVSYLMFDERSGALCSDVSGNGNIGIISNAVRVCSSAPIGDDSAFSYSGPFTATLASPHGDNITISEYGGTWGVAQKSGIQVYRVDSKPNYTNSPSGWNVSFASSLRYWGTFIIGGTGPTYTMEYNYDGYPGIINEDILKIGFRNNYCNTQWLDLQATLDTAQKLLIKSGLSGTEFILGSNVDPRNAINFSGIGDYVGVADSNSLDLAATGTLEAWIFIDNYTANGGIIHKGDNTDLSDEAYSLSLNSTDNKIVLTVRDGSGADSVTSNTALAEDTWYHVAGVWDDAANTMAIYINGVLDQSGASARTAWNTAGSLNIGQQFTAGAGSYNPFDGYIDEVRIWNEVRNQNQIRNTMCHTLSGTETGLVGYWRFDEETTDVTSPDGTTSRNTATMYGFGTDGAVIAARICSSAPIGKASAWDYFDIGSPPVSAVLSHPAGDYMLATENGGDWVGTFSGLHIYLIDHSPVYPPDINGPLPYNPYEAPNGLTPPYPPNAATNWSSIDYYRYWGVFLADWATGASEPTYDIIYYYGTVGNGNPNVPADADPSDPNDPQIGLARRDSYCDLTWEDSLADWQFGTLRLVLTGDSQNGPKQNPEYILGGINKPLAISLALFTAELIDGCIEINWETATEIDTIGFQLWRSDRKDGEYTLVPYSYTDSASVIETMSAKYSFSDCYAALDDKTNYYYKLEEVDMDNSKANPMYGPIGPVSEVSSAAQVPNAAGSNNNKACFISIIDE